MVGWKEILILKAVLILMKKLIPHVVNNQDESTFCWLMAIVFCHSLMLNLKIQRMIHMCFGLLIAAEFQTVSAKTLRRSVRAFIHYTMSTFAKSRY